MNAGFVARQTSPLGCLLLVILGIILLPLVIIFVAVYALISLFRPPRARRPRQSMADLFSAAGFGGAAQRRPDAAPPETADIPASEAIIDVEAIEVDAVRIDENDSGSGVK